jgi:hypothetical protein
MSVLAVKLVSDFINARVLAAADEVIAGGHGYRDAR